MTPLLYLLNIKN